MSKKIRFKVYLITDRTFCKKSFLEVIESACKAGIKAIQLREKDLPAKELLELALKVRKITAKYKTKLFINDRIDIAKIVNADGVQLTENSLPINIVKRIAPELIIGVSRHTLESCIEAEKSGANFIVYGSVFKSKKGFEAQGLDKLRLICSKIKIPVFAVGGVNSENAKSCIDNGVFGVAVVSGIMGSGDVEGEVRKLTNS